MDIETVLTRGVSEVLPSRKGLAALMKKKKITLYQGFDPSKPDLHIGHLIGIRKLAQFQELGHKVIFLIGDFTGMIGDPTDKSSARQKLTHKEVLKNAKTYQEQVKKVLRFEGENGARIMYNSEWLGKLKFEEIIELASNFTVQQLMERDFFQERIKREKPIHLHEFLYPLMVGVDCIEMNVDLEIGGSDQMFNMMAGRHLMKAVKDKGKYVLTMKLLADTGGVKMSKTEGNAVGLNDEPSEIYGKVMAMGDSMLADAIEMLSDLPADLISNKGPLDAKKDLARDVVKQLHGEKKAKLAEGQFEKTFQKGQIPNEMKVVKVSSNEMVLLDLIFETGEVESRSAVKRLIKEGAVDVDGMTVTDPQVKVDIDGGAKLKIGKRKFVKVEPK